MNGAIRAKSRCCGFLWQPARAMPLTMLACWAAGPHAIAQQASFTGVGDLPGGNVLSECYAVSGDGRVIVGGSITGGGGFSQQFSPFRWTQEEGIRALVTEFGSTVAAAVSSDGSVIVGYADFGVFSPLGAQAFRWTQTTGVVLLGDLPGGNIASFGRAMSSDGSRIAGIGASALGTEAFVLDVETAAFTPLGALSPNPFASFAVGMSGDGTVVVGASSTPVTTQSAFRWTAAGGMQALGLPQVPTGVVPASNALAISRDGQVIVGQARNMTSGQGGEAFRWTQAGGYEFLGDLPGGAFQSFAYASNADGSVIVGRASVQGTCGPFGCGSFPRAFIWTRASGMQDLPELLRSKGLDLTGWRLDEARGVSDDGRVIVGTGLNPRGQIEGWVADLGAAECRADFNANGTLDFFDYLDLVAAFDASEPASDYDGNGTIDFFDYLDFVDDFAAGCE
jgi:uncharacterized membrane protein